MIIPVLFVVFLVVYFFVINPAQEDKKKAAKEAAKIAKYFGNTEITLFHFPDDRGEYGAGGTYVFVEFNPRFHDVRDLLKHDNHYIVTSWTEKGANKRKDAIKTIRMIEQHLPYSCRELESPYSFAVYKNAIHKVDGSYLMGPFTF